MTVQVRVGAPRIWEPKEGDGRPIPTRCKAGDGGRNNRNSKSFPTKNAALACLSGEG